MSENEKKSIVDGVQWDDSSLKSAVKKMEAVLQGQQEKTRMYDDRSRELQKQIDVHDEMNTSQKVEQLSDLAKQLEEQLAIMEGKIEDKRAEANTAKREVRKMQGKIRRKTENGVEERPPAREDRPAVGGL